MDRAVERVCVGEGVSDSRSAARSVSYHDLSIDVPKLYRIPTIADVVNPVPFRNQSDAPCVGISETWAYGAHRL